jgi:hypothetical protein
MGLKLEDVSYLMLLTRSPLSECNKVEAVVRVESVVGTDFW